MNIYLGTSLIAASTLGLEILLTRLLSVTTWYHLAFLAISVAMLGMTAGATTVFLRPSWFSEENLSSNIAKACVVYAFASAVSLVMLCLVPMKPPTTAIGVFSMLVTTICSSLPFYCSGVAISAVLTKCPLPIGRLYASDLLGASLGCLAVLAGFEVLDVPSLILLFGAVGVVAGYCFAWHLPKFAQKRASLWILGSFAGLILLNTASPYGIAPLMVKGRLEDVSQYVYEQWNSFSRIVVYEGKMSVPQLWGGSPRRPQRQLTLQHAINIDGEAGTFVTRFSSISDISHLKYDATNIAYYLRPSGGACVIGVGGGRDVQSAILFGHERVLGVEVNPIFIELLRGKFRDFAGLVDDERVELVVDEARSYLARSDENFAVIQMSLTDTWAATGAGAFSLSENGLYTLEAWKLFIRRLNEDGIFTVSRWYNPHNLGETGRAVSLAVAALLESGVSDPSQHLAMFTVGRISTLLLAKAPFTEADRAKLHEVTLKLGYRPVIYPGIVPRTEVLRDIVSVRSREQLSAAVRNASLNYEPPTDDNPYFFNMLRLDQLSAVMKADAGVVQGNLVASVNLLGLILCLMILTVITVVLPLEIKRRSQPEREEKSAVLWPGAAYFSLIGAGFMLVEIALLQRLSVFLGHPVYALGILLFTIIASTGCGSFLSERLPLTDRPWVYAPAIGMAILIVAVPNALPATLTALTAAEMTQKIFAAVGLIFPLGVVMGMFFPTGMRLARLTSAEDTPWFWALNGIFGVLCSAVAVFVSIYFGIAVNFYIAAMCYGTVALCAHRMAQSVPNEAAP
jgi:hypothetical protein